MNELRKKSPDKVENFIAKKSLKDRLLHLYPGKWGRVMSAAVMSFVPSFLVNADPIVLPAEPQPQVRSAEDISTANQDYLEEFGLVDPQPSMDTSPSTSEITQQVEDADHAFPEIPQQLMTADLMQDYINNFDLIPRSQRFIAIIPDGGLSSEERQQVENHRQDIQIILTYFNNFKDLFRNRDSSQPLSLSELAQIKVANSSSEVELLQDGSLRMTVGIEHPDGSRTSVIWLATANQLSMHATLVALQNMLTNVHADWDINTELVIKNAAAYTSGGRYNVVDTFSSVGQVANPDGTTRTTGIISVNAIRTNPKAEELLVFIDFMNGLVGDIETDTLIVNGDARAFQGYVMLAQPPHEDIWMLIQEQNGNS